MKSEFKPQTIEEYRSLCRALQVKYLKREKEIQTNKDHIQRLNQEIESIKSFAGGNNAKDQAKEKNGVKAKGNFEGFDDLETLQGKKNVMIKFKNGASEFGVTPESIFRIADFCCKSEVESDYFRQALAKMNLGLSPLEMSTLIYIFDESYTGFISREDFSDTLSAFGISLEESCLPYTSYCLEKLAKLMETQKIEAVKFYKEMLKKNETGVNLNQFHEKIKNTFGNKLELREVIGSFHAIDLESDDIVYERNFVYSVTSAINKLSAQSNANSKRNFDEINENNQFRRSNMSIKKNTGRRENNSEAPDNSQSLANAKFTKDTERPILNEFQNDDNMGKILEASNLSLNEIYEEICLQPLNLRLTLFNFRNILKKAKSEKQFNSQLSGVLFKAIDHESKGTIHYNELITFYLRHGTDMTFILRIICLFLKNNEMNCENFWFLNGISVDSDISKSKFLEVMDKNFGEGVQELWVSLWKYFDNGKGVIAVQSFIKELQKYELSS